MKLYLIRHAKPELRDYKGFPGPSLGEAGREQARTIADYLKDKDITQVLASDYTRVIETMQPFLDNHPYLEVKEYIALREREKDVERHISLVNRVHRWFQANENMIVQKHTAIFSHCGPINMILSYLDPQKKLFEYPYEDKWGCHTPLGQIWELELDGKVVKGCMLIL